MSGSADIDCACSIDIDKASKENSESTVIAELLELFHGELTDKRTGELTGFAYEALKYRTHNELITNPS